MKDTTIDRSLPRIDLELVSDLVPVGARVLDLGCGDGTLLKMLIDRKGVVGRGVEISDAGVRQCIMKGLSVHHGDIDEGLLDYPDNSFDCVILSQTLQTVHKPLLVLEEMLRVGRVGIVSFPNFGYWQIRWRLLSTGKMPKSNHLPYDWYDTPNIHLLTVADFHELCARQSLIIDKGIFLRNGRQVKTCPNLFAKIAIFVVRKA